MYSQSTHGRRNIIYYPMRLRLCLLRGVLITSNSLLSRLFEYLVYSGIQIFELSLSLRQSEVNTPSFRIVSIVIYWMKSYRIYYPELDAIIDV